MLILLAMTLSLAQAEPGDLSSGADLQAWRSMGAEASEAQVRHFLQTYSHSPLAELAVRRLEASGASIPMARLERVLESVLNHDARLAAGPVSVAIAPVAMKPLDPAERPPSGEATVAAAEE
jgi:hypothetical protein